MTWSRAGYLLQRIARNLLPAPLARAARRRFGGIPGGESEAPELFAEHYVETLGRYGRTFVGAEVLVFGHGPSYGFACALLATGAERVHLYDPYARPDDRLNARWLERYPDCLERRDGTIRPRPRKMRPVESAGEPEAVTLPAVDVVVSTSVFEHLDDVDLWVDKLALAGGASGFHVHMIDLRDHFFHLPFEMLCYSERVWKRWLNPRQHLNRWRIGDYEAAFRRRFAWVEVEVLTSEPEAFEAARGRIREEFLSGDPARDAVAEIEVCAREPR